MSTRDAGSNDPWFAERLPLLQLVMDETQHTVPRVHEGLYHWLAHYHQVMLLAAGIVGVVVPLLYAQGSKLIDPWYLRWSVLCFGVSMLLGVLISFVSKWTLTFVMEMVQRHVSALYGAIWGAVDEASALANLHAVAEEYQPKGARILRLVRAGAVGDLFFYGTFLAGIAFLMSGFTASWK
jgi:hypothetical protein